MVKNRREWKKINIHELTNKSERAMNPKYSSIQEIFLSKAGISMPKMSARLRDPDLSQNDSGILPTVKMPQGKKKKPDIKMRGSQ